MGPLATSLDVLDHPESYKRAAFPSYPLDTPPTVVDKPEKHGIVHLVQERLPLHAILLNNPKKRKRQSKKVNSTRFDGKGANVHGTKYSFQDLYGSLQSTIIEEMRSESEAHYTDSFYPVQVLLGLSSKQARRLHKGVAVGKWQIPEHLRERADGGAIDPDKPPPGAVREAMAYLEQENLPLTLLGDWLSYGDSDTTPGNPNPRTPHNRQHGVAGSSEPDISPCMRYREPNESEINLEDPSNEGEHDIREAVLGLDGHFHFFSLFDMLHRNIGPEQPKRLNLPESQPSPQSQPRQRTSFNPERTSSRPRTEKVLPASRVVFSAPFGAQQAQREIEQSRVRESEPLDTRRSRSNGRPSPLTSGAKQFLYKDWKRQSPSQPRLAGSAKAPVKSPVESLQSISAAIRAGRELASTRPYGLAPPYTETMARSRLTDKRDLDASILPTQQVEKASQASELPTSSRERRGDQQTDITACSSPPKSSTQASLTASTVSQAPTVGGVGDNRSIAPMVTSGIHVRSGSPTAVSGHLPQTNSLSVPQDLQTRLQVEAALPPVSSQAIAQQPVRGFTQGANSSTHTLSAVSTSAVSPSAGDPPELASTQKFPSLSRPASQALEQSGQQTPAPATDESATTGIVYMTGDPSKADREETPMKVEDVDISPSSNADLGTVPVTSVPKQHSQKASSNAAPSHRASSLTMATKTPMLGDPEMNRMKSSMAAAGLTKPQAVGTSQGKAPHPPVNHCFQAYDDGLSRSSDLSDSKTSALGPTSGSIQAQWSIHGVQQPSVPRSLEEVMQNRADGIRESLKIHPHRTHSTSPMPIFQEGKTMITPSPFPVPGANGPILNSTSMNLGECETITVQRSPREALGNTNTTSAAIDNETLANLKPPPGAFSAENGASLVVQSHSSSTMGPPSASSYVRATPQAWHALPIESYQSTSVKDPPAASLAREVMIGMVDSEKHGDHTFDKRSGLDTYTAYTNVATTEPHNYNKLAPSAWTPKPTYTADGQAGYHLGMNGYPVQDLNRSSSLGPHSAQMPLSSSASPVQQASLSDYIPWVSRRNPVDGGQYDPMDASIGPAASLSNPLSEQEQNGLVKGFMSRLGSVVASSPVAGWMGVPGMLNKRKSAPTLGERDEVMAKKARIHR